MLLCLSRNRTIALVDAISKDHDKEVHVWRKNLASARNVEQVSANKNRVILFIFILTLAELKLRANVYGAGTFFGL